MTTFHPSFDKGYRIHIFVHYFIYCHSSSTLFIGESEYGFYALPSLVDEQTVTIVPKYVGPPLIDGPTPLLVAQDQEKIVRPIDDRPYLALDTEKAKMLTQQDAGEFVLLGKSYKHFAIVVNSMLMYDQIQI